MITKNLLSLDWKYAAFCIFIVGKLDSITGHYIVLVTDLLVLINILSEKRKLLSSRPITAVTAYNTAICNL